MKFDKKPKVLQHIDNIVSNTEIAIDDNGGIILENFKKVLEYNNTQLTIETKRRIVYIYGTDLMILSCNKNNATAYGNIEKIEFFFKEV